MQQTFFSFECTDNMLQYSQMTSVLHGTGQLCLMQDKAQTYIHIVTLHSFVHVMCHTETQLASVLAGLGQVSLNQGRFLAPSHAYSLTTNFHLRRQCATVLSAVVSAGGLGQFCLIHERLGTSKLASVLITIYSFVQAYTAIIWLQCW